MVQSTCVLTLTAMALSVMESVLKRRYPHHKMNFEALIRELNPKILGFATFFRHVLSSKARSTIDKEIYEALQIFRGKNSKYKQ
jgi:hypothetical protein